MTHLTSELQRQWLREIRRVLVPGGVFVTSVHGPFATRGLPPDLQQKLHRSGIVDSILDSAIDGVAPQGYYRGTFQTVEYTFDQWGKELEILDYREGGLANHQDLVILRRDRGGKNWFGRMLSLREGKSERKPSASRLP